MGTTSVLTVIFRQLFRDCPYRRARLSAAGFPWGNGMTAARTAGMALNRGQRHQRRCLNLPTRDKLFDKNNWQPRSRKPSQDMTEEFNKAPLETARSLEKRKVRPKMCKMLVRDYIDDCLYNPHYGYFSKEAVIFSSPEPFEFRHMKNELEFDRQLLQKYTDFEDKLDADKPNEIRQLWHTPTELFRPYYGEAIARYLYENYLDWYPMYDLVIYELGAGNGTLMVNVLDFLKLNFPDVYKQTRFKIIEISPRLADRQRHAAAVAGHSEHVDIVNTSFFNFDQFVSTPCFFLALEVFDNFAHDMVRYDPETEEVLQGWLLVDQEGDFHEMFTRQLDYETERFLKMRHSVYDPRKDPFYEKMIAKSFGSRRGQSTFNNAVEQLRRKLFTLPNLSAPEFLPIRMVQFFEILNARFPHHRLIMSDFNYLPDTIEGINAPVVQTRYKRTTVPITHLYAHQGYFDILFPTNFEMARLLYQLICGKFSQITTQEQFMKEWAELSDTTTRSGENPLLNWYQNASVLCTD